MTDHDIVSRSEWLEARQALLAREKAFTRERDELSRARRALPWVRLDKDYGFEGANGHETLGDLFAGRRQLLVYHFMFDPGWSAGCKSCSFWADGFDRIVVHLKHRDIAMAVTSTAPFAVLDGYRKRMGWSFPWLSSAGSDFNRDFGVTFTDEDRAGGATYNYGTRTFKGPEAPGASAFIRDGDAVYHTYSCYGRGLDMLNPAYQWMDIAPLGRDEDALPSPMDWVRRHDEYPA